jgi:hypothetical protein
VTIDSQCYNIELTSPVYFIKDATCHIQFPQRVNSESIMKFNFKTSIDRETFGGVLVYHLQRKKNDKFKGRSNTDKNTSTSIQLLVIWGYKSHKPYSHAWLIEHERTLVWSKDKLKRLWHVYHSQDSMELVSNRKKWLLNDNMRLKTEYETSYGGFEMKIIISEERHRLYPIKPLWIDPNRQVSTLLMISCINIMLSVFFSIMCSKYMFIINVQISS